MKRAATTALLLALLANADGRGQDTGTSPELDILPGRTAKARTRVVIRGTRSISEREVLKLLGDRLVFVRTKRPTPALAEDAAFMVQRLLRENGFTEARVSPSVAPGSVVLQVDEGPRLGLGSVFVPKLPKEDAKRLSLLFSSVAEKRQSDLGTKAPFLQSDVGEGLSLITADLLSRGYWKATAEVDKQKADPQTGEVNLVIRVDPGPLHRISRPRFEGDVSGLRDRIDIATAPFIDQPATASAINQLRAAVEEVFRSSGYTDASIRMGAEALDGRVLPTFEIVAGESYQFGRLDFDGLTKTRPEAVERFLQGLGPGVYDEAEIDRRIRALLATGAFSAVRLDTDARGDVLDATLHLEEGAARGSAAYAGFGTYEGPIIGGRYYDRNLGGRLLNFSVGAELTSRTMLGDLHLSQPWFNGTSSSRSARLFAVSRSHEGYDTFETGAGFELTWEFGRDRGFTPLRWLTSASWVDASSTGIPPSQMGDTYYSHLRTRLSLGIDRRDDPLRPTRGWHAVGAAAVGLASGASQVGYLRLEANTGWYIPIADRNQLSLGLRGGVILPSSGVDLPIDLRAFLGGPDSVRSFPERELGPRTIGNYPHGGEAWWVANAEYAHRIAGPLMIVAFTDAGGLSSDYEDFGLDEIELALGLGLRLDLPIGPVRFEYGHNLTKDDNEPSGTWHLAIGIAF